AALKEHALKRRAISSIKDLPSVPDGVADYTPPASQEEVLDPETVPVNDLDDYFKTPSPVKQPAAAPVFEPTSAQPYQGKVARTASGAPFYIPKKLRREAISYEQLIASRSVVAQGQARQSY